MEYTDDNRGLFQRPDRAKQLISFLGIKIDKITPTDIDQYFEYHNKLFVFSEFKHGNQKIPRGQLLALMRAVDAIEDGGKKAVLFICSHNVHNVEDVVYSKDASVIGIYKKKQWFVPKGEPLSHSKAIDFEIEKVKEKEWKWTNSR